LRERGTGPRIRGVTVKYAWPAALVLAASIGCPAVGPPNDVPAGLREVFEDGGLIETYRGLCDASAVAWIDPEHFVVAEDERNELRVYRRAQPDAVGVIALDDFLEVDAAHPEADLEAAAVLGDEVYWLASHSRNKNAKPRPSRRRFFATAWNGATIEPIGKPYRQLLMELIADERYAVFDLEAAARRAPKRSSGFNLEGLSAWGDGALLIGVRNPVPDGLALAIPLLNPKEIVHEGARAIFGEPLRLDLGGAGIRSIEALGEDEFLIAAGSPAGSSDRLFFWSGSPQAVPVGIAGLDLNVEGMAYRAEEGRLLLASDDGTRLVAGAECKSIPDAAAKRFRVRRLEGFQTRSVVPR